MIHVKTLCTFRRFKLALISKGLRLFLLITPFKGFSFQACPDFKGIKTDQSDGLRKFQMFQACPDFKGIKTESQTCAWKRCLFQACPDFKGIKTPPGNTADARSPFQACPDFKGIKTRWPCPMPLLRRFKLALISKGLRPQRVVAGARQAGFQACPDFKGIKTISLLRLLMMPLFQACPDFKGIKTV